MCEGWLQDLQARLSTQQEDVAAKDAQFIQLQEQDASLEAILAEAGHGTPQQATSHEEDTLAAPEVSQLTSDSSAHEQNLWPLLTGRHALDGTSTSALPHKRMSSALAISNALHPSSIGASSFETEDTLDNII